MSRSFVELGKKHPGWAVIIVVAIEIVAAALIWFSGEWFYAGSVETFGPLNSYAFLWVGIGIASVAATSTFFALLSTKESLELTRGTQRPFLNVTVELPFSMSIDRAIVQPEVQNTGNLPADNVLIICKWFIQDNDTIKEQPLRKEKDNPTIIFPGEKIILPFTIEGEEAVSKRTHSGSRVKVIIE